MHFFFFNLFFFFFIFIFFSEVLVRARPGRLRHGSVRVGAASQVHLRAQVLHADRPPSEPPAVQSRHRRPRALLRLEHHVGQPPGVLRVNEAVQHRPELGALPLRVLLDVHVPVRLRLRGRVEHVLDEHAEARVPHGGQTPALHRSSSGSLGRHHHRRRQRRGGCRLGPTSRTRVGHPRRQVGLPPPHAAPHGSSHRRWGLLPKRVHHGGLGHARQPVAGGRRVEFRHEGDPPHRVHGRPRHFVQPPVQRFGAPRASCGRPPRVRCRGAVRVVRKAHPQHPPHQLQTLHLHLEHAVGRVGFVGELDESKPFGSAGRLVAVDLRGVNGAEGRQHRLEVFFSNLRWQVPHVDLVLHARV
mmetsp:Transcript_89380/g.173134  ORF Transcript_89380/g.173134 Transcript_89380/m.173134 type:complete len:357 (+) Transcript_89380:728-1798(+)